MPLVRARRACRGSRACSTRLPLPDLGLDRLLATHLLGRLVLAQALVRRARAAGRRASTRRTRPRRRASARPRRRRRLRTLRHLRHDSERRLVPRERSCSFASSSSISASSKPGADSCRRSCEPVPPLTAEDERAEVADAPSLPCV